MRYTYRIGIYACIALVMLLLQPALLFVLLSVYCLMKRRGLYKQWLRLHAFLRLQRHRHVHSIYLGNMYGRAVFTEASNHVMVIGASGRGKSQQVIIPNVMHLPTALVVHDIKGEIFSATSRHRAHALGQRICVLDFDSADSAQFNIFDTGLPIEDAIAICQQHLFHGNDYFTATASDCFKKIALLYHQQHQTLSLSSLYIAIHQPMASIRKTYDWVFRDIASKMQHLVVQHMRTAMAALASKSVRYFCHGNTIPFQQLRAGNITIYVQVHPQSQARLGPLYRIFWETLMRLLTQDIQVNNMVTLVIDELAFLGRVALLDYLPIARGYGIQMLLAAQSFEQLGNSYPSVSELKNLAYCLYLGGRSLDDLRFFQAWCPTPTHANLQNLAFGQGILLTPQHSFRLSFPKPRSFHQ